MPNEDQESGEPGAPPTQLVPEHLFSNIRTALSGELAGDVEGQAAMQEIQARYLLALARPRNVDQIRQDALKEAKRWQFADSAIGLIKFGGDEVEYPTIRFAEMLYSLWGNCGLEASVAAEREMDRDVRVVVSDYQRNVHFGDRLTLSKLVERKFPKKGQKTYGKRQNSDGDWVHKVEAAENELLGKTQSLKSKAARGSILRMVPRWLWEEVYEECGRTIQAKVKTDPDAEKKKVIDGFGQLHVKVADLEEYFGFPVDKWTTADIVKAKKLWQTVQSGEIPWADLLREAKAAREKAAEAPKEGAPAAPPKKATKLEETRPVGTPKPSSSPSPSNEATKQEERPRPVQFDDYERPKQTPPQERVPRNEDEGQLEGSKTTPFDAVKPGGTLHQQGTLYEGAAELAKASVIPPPVKAGSAPPPQPDESLAIYGRLRRIRVDKKHPQNALCVQLLEARCKDAKLEIQDAVYLPAPVLANIEAAVKAAAEGAGQ